MNPVAQAAAESALAAVEAKRALNPDAIEIAAELSHQLETARTEIETLKGAMRELGVGKARAEAARDVLKELLIEAMRR